jgi:FixJ family two-component response regulator
MKSGAIDFLIKPFREQDLLEAVNRALDQDGNGLKKKAKESFAELARMVGEVQKKGCGST